MKQLLVSVMFVIVPGLAFADGSSPEDDTPDATNLAMAGDSSTINIECGPPSTTRPRTTTCRMNQFAITRPPNATQIKERLAAVDKRASSPEAKKEVAALCKKVGAPSADAVNARDLEVQFVDRLARACAAKDDAALWNTLKWKIKEVDGQTCGIQPYRHYDEIYTQLDANTWQAITNDGGYCGTTVVRTLWRKPGDRLLWNYKQVRSVPPNATNPNCAMFAKNPVLEWTWRDKETTFFGCTYFRF